MEIIYSNDSGQLNISLIGELDDAAAESARTSIDNTLSRVHYKNVLIDMSRLKFMDSTGIGILIGRFKKYKEVSNFFITSPTQTVDKILKLSGIYSIMPKIR